METTTVALEDIEVRSEDGRHYLEGIAVPWGKRTDKVAVPELFERGAFDDLVSSGATVKLTARNHEREHFPVGYSTAIEDTPEGLWLRWRLNNTPQGRDAHENLVEGVYGGLSIGFITRGDEMVSGVRHVKSARLHHVSLVEEPAYTDAVITALRSAQMDELAVWRQIAAPRELAIDIRDRGSQTLLMAKFRR